MNSKKGIRLRISFLLLCACVLLQACDLPKYFKATYDECFPFMPIGQEINTSWKFTHSWTEASVFDVFQWREHLVDPVTGENLGSERTKVGQIRITSVEEKFSKGFGESGGPFKIGMILQQ